MKRIAIFASGAGSNAHNILRYFRHSNRIQAALIGSNKADAGVLKVAEEFDVPTFLIAKSDFTNPESLIAKLQTNKIDFIVLAGFLWKLPEALIQAFPNKIVNIHPSLLPKYGGKGMYGHFVHEAVFNNREKFSGITIHLVNEHYDEGNIIFQKNVAINEADTVESIEQKVRALEIEHFPAVIEQLLLSTN